MKRKLQGGSRDYVILKGQISQKRLGNTAIGDEGFEAKERKMV